MVLTNMLLFQNLITQQQGCLLQDQQRANLMTKTDFDDKLKHLNQKINSNKTKHLLVENELKKLRTFDSIYFRGESHFEEDGTQNYSEIIGNP